MTSKPVLAVAIDPGPDQRTESNRRGSPIGVKSQPALAGFELKRCPRLML
jgi:hypothetical protein